MGRARERRINWIALTLVALVLVIVSDLFILHARLHNNAPPIAPPLTVVAHSSHRCVLNPKANPCSRSGPLRTVGPSIPNAVEGSQHVR